MLGIFKSVLNKFRKRRYSDIAPDEIFMDSQNLPDFDTHQFEGRIEKPISKLIFNLFSLICVLSFVVFISRFWTLQITNGDEYKKRSENNKLKQILLVAPRGTIYDRGGVTLAWNDQSVAETDFPKRKYIPISGLSSILGFVKYPAKDKNGFYYEENYIPKDGLELYFNEILTGRNGLKLLETSVNGDVVSESVVDKAKNGEDVKLSIDSRIQNKLYKTISDLSASSGFSGGAGIIIDVKSGEVLSSVSYPEYDSNIMTEGEDKDKIQKYLENSNNVFLNRVYSGLYTPGSIVKPFIAYGALEEGVITPEKEIVSTGQLVVPNPYFPDKPSIFNDWKAHGAVDMRRAIAVSSDIYFYEIGGGFQDQKGLGIERIEKYMRLFGFGEKTGVIFDKEEIGILPNPVWKAENFDGEIWRVGDTYNTAIGQYGVQVTPVQAVRAIAAIANGGSLVEPTFIFTATSSSQTGIRIKGNPENFQIVREGMQGSVEFGTAVGLNTTAVEIGGKTGTAELGAKKQFVNSWTVGFFPYNNPHYAYAIVMEKGPRANLVGATYVMRQLIDWMAVNTPEYLE